MRVILKVQEYFQGMNRDADVENEHIDLGVGEEGETNWESSKDMKTLSVHTQSHLILWNSVKCSPAGSSVHGVS